MSLVMKIALIIISWGIYGELKKSEDTTGIWMMMLTLFIIVG